MGKDRKWNSTSGGPREESHIVNRVRKGQVDWVPPLSKAAEFKSWRFRFSMGAGCYLTTEVYPSDDERRCAWQIALLRAATLGNFGEMIQLLELWDNDGVTCEDLLQRLERQFMPSVEAELKKAMQHFVAFSRGKRSLSQAVKDLKVALLECQKQGYRPDPQKKQLKFEALLSATEIPILRLYTDQEKRLQGSLGGCRRANGGKDDAAEFEVFMRALEALAKDQEEQRSNVDSSNGPFAGGAFDKTKDADGKKKSHQPKRSGYRGDGGKDEQKCPKCGFSCGAVRGKGKDKCPAVDKECRKCGKKGHFESVCRSGKSQASKTDKKQNEKSNSKASAAMGGRSDCASEECFH